MPEASQDKRVWWHAALLLAIVFVAANFQVVSGDAAPIWDAESFFVPAFTLISDFAHEGRILLWNPWQSGGSPDYAEPELGAISPVTLLVAASTDGTDAGFRTYWLLIWILGPLGMLILARHLGAPPWGAFLVAMGFAFSGFYTGQAQYMSSLYAISFFPWFLWRLDVALATQKIKPAMESGALWGLSALGGYPQLTILSAFFMVLWALGRWLFAPTGEPIPVSRPKSASRVLALAVIPVIGVLVLAPAYIAFFAEGKGYSDRVGTRSRQEALESNALEPGALLTFSSPHLATLMLYDANAALWSDTPLSMATIYLGAPITILALLSLVSRPKSCWRWWLAGLALLFLACAVGHRLPLRGWLYDFCPPTRYFRNGALFRVYAMYCFAFLALEAAKDLDAARQDAASRIWKQLLLTSIVTAAGAAAAYAYVISTVQTPGELFFEANGHLALVWLGSVLLAALFLLSRKARASLPVLLGILTVLDATIAYRLAQPVVYSTGSARSIWSKLNARHRGNLDLTANGLNREPRPPSWVGLHENNENVPMKLPTFFNYATLTNRFQENFNERPVLVAMSTGERRIWFSSEAATVTPTDTFYKSLVERSEALNAPVLLVHPPEEMPRIRERDVETPGDRQNVEIVSRLPAAQQLPARVLRYSSDYLSVEVDCPSDGWLLVTDRWSSGWTATVNDQPVPLFGGNFIFRAVRVKSGDNKVRFYYSPLGWPYLVFVSWGTLAVVFAGPLVAPKRLRAYWDRVSYEPAPMESPRKFKIGLVQMACSTDPDDNLRRAIGFIEKAAVDGARVVCLPELFRSQYFCQCEDAALFDLAEPVPGPTTEALSKVAKKASVVLIVPLFERRAPGIYHNSVAVIDSDGKMLGLYRKMHIPDDPAYYEKFYFTPGDLGFRAFETSVGPLASLICWDQWYPEGARLAALQGANLLFYPTAIGWHPAEKESHGATQRDAWRTVQRAHAISNGVYLAAANRIGHEKPTDAAGLEFWGSSFICDPQGVILAEASADREEILLAEVNLDVLEDIRRNWPFLRDRRIDAYAGIDRRYLA